MELEKKYRADGTIFWAEKRPVCTDCSGSGVVPQERDVVVTCPTCRGQGFIGPEPRMLPEGGFTVPV